MNGRRMVPTGTGSTVDMNAIPMNAIKSIEILKAGGSVTYGTSAVAGVINFILDDEFEGFDVDIFYGNTTDTDVHEVAASFITGGVSESGKFHYVIGGNYREEGGMYAPDRDYAMGGGTSATPNPGALYLGDTWYEYYDADAGAFLDGSDNPMAEYSHLVSAYGATYNSMGSGWYPVIMDPFITAIESANGNAPSLDPAAGNYIENYGYIYTLKDGVIEATGPQDFRPWVNAMPEDGGDRFPYENYTTMVSPNEQYNVYAFTDYQVNEKVNLFTEMMYSHSTQTFQLAPSPAGFSIPTSNYYTNLVFGGTSYDYNGDGVADDFIDTASYIYDGYGYDGTYIAYRHVGFGPRLNITERDTFRIVMGADVDLGNDWSMEAYALYTEEQWTDRELNGGSSLNFDTALADSTADGSFNMFSAAWVRVFERGAGYAVDPAPNADIIEFIRANNTTLTKTTTELVDAKVSNDHLFEIDSRPVGVVFGAEYRRQTAYQEPDFVKLNGATGWNAADGITDGLRDVWGVYGEVGLPVLEKVDLFLSARYEDYRNEFETDVYAARVRYQPTDEITLRASWSMGFVAPDIIDVFNPGFGSFPELNDPYFPSSDPGRLYQVETQYVGSQVTGIALQPEESDIYSVGVTYSPKFAKGLDVTVDYWRIEQSNLIVYSVQGLVTEFRQSYTGGADGSYTDPPVTSPYLSTNGGPIVYDWGSPEPISQILGAGPRNVDGALTEGIDFTINYLMNTDNWGSFKMVWDSTYYMSQEQQSGITGEWYSFNGEYDGDVAYPRFSSQLRVLWAIGDFDVSTTVNYVGQSDDLNFDPGEGKDQIEAHSEVDVQVNYKPSWLEFGESTTISIGAENLFDEKPPLSAGAFSNNYPERNYDPRGLFYYFKIKQSF